MDKVENELVRLGEIEREDEDKETDVEVDTNVEEVGDIPVVVVVVKEPMVVVGKVPMVVVGKDPMVVVGVGIADVIPEVVGDVTVVTAADVRVKDVTPNVVGKVPETGGGGGVVNPKVVAPGVGGEDVIGNTSVLIAVNVNVGGVPMVVGKPPDGVGVADIDPEENSEEIIVEAVVPKLVMDVPDAEITEVGMGAADVKDRGPVDDQMTVAG